MSEFENPWWLSSAEYWGAKGMFRRAAAMGTTIGATVISAPRYVPESRPYVYRGTGADTLTAFMDDEPDDAGRLTRRQERIGALASLPPLHLGPEPEPPRGHITAAQAAEMLGVTQRTIERYKRELAGRTALTGFGDVLIGCFPAIIMTIYVLSAILAAVSALRLLAWGIRWWRDGEWQLARAQRLAAIDQATRTPVTRPMSAAVQDALTPRMVAPTRADLIASCGFCHDIAVMGDADDCRCEKPCGVRWCTALRRQAERETS